MIVFVSRKGDRTNRYACERIDANTDAYRCGMCRAVISRKQVVDRRHCDGCGGSITVLQDSNVVSG